MILTGPANRYLVTETLLVQIKISVFLTCLLSVILLVDFPTCNKNTLEIFLQIDHHLSNIVFVPQA